jgi:hypothetical protein
LVSHPRQLGPRVRDVVSGLTSALAERLGQVEFGIENMPR